MLTGLRLIAADLSVLENLEAVLLLVRPVLSASIRILIILVAEPPSTILQPPSNGPSVQLAAVHPDRKIPVRQGRKGYRPAMERRDRDSIVIARADLGLFARIDDCE